jgi:hypothetical protein
MANITLDLRDKEPILRLSMIGDVDDEGALQWFKAILKGHPHARDWPSLVDLREYQGGITWDGIVEIARIRGRAPVGPKNRTAVIANRRLYDLLIDAVDVVYSVRIARRVRLFDTEADALAWLNDGRKPARALEPATQ